MSKDRRRIPRVPVFFLLESLSLPVGSSGEACQGVVKNITPDGLLLETNALVEKQDVLRLSFTLPNTQQALNLEGQSRWVERKKAWATVGVEFVHLTPEQRQQIMDYLITLGLSA